MSLPFEYGTFAVAGPEPSSWIGASEEEETQKKAEETKICAWPASVEGFE